MPLFAFDEFVSQNSNFESQNSHSTNANFDQLCHITINDLVVSQENMPQTRRMIHEILMIS